MFSDDLRPRGSSDALTHDIPLHELQCYNLPFGGLGFTSHILTYYTIACLWFGRKPLWPFKKIHYTKLDLVLASIGLALCIVMSIITMVNCKNTWQLLVIGVWKMSMSLLNGVTALHVAILVVNDAEEQVMKSRKAAWWLLLCELGCPSIFGASVIINFFFDCVDRCTRDDGRDDRTHEPCRKSGERYSRVAGHHHYILHDHWGKPDSQHRFYGHHLLLGRRRAGKGCRNWFCGHFGTFLGL